MARAPRLTAAGLTYHVYARGNNRSVLFRSDEEYRWFWVALGEIVLRHGWRMFAVALLPNHFHLVFETPEDNLSQGMQRFLTRAAQYLNRRHDTTGHIFQGRFGYRICQQEAYLLELIRYVHLNPVSAGLVVDPADWTWSGHQEYLGRRATPWLEPSDGLVLFASEGASRAILVDRYLQFLADRVGAERFARWVESQLWVGEEEFVERVKHARELPVRVAARPSLKGVSLQRIAEWVCSTMGLTVDELRGRRRSRQVSAGRRAFALLAVRYAHEQVTAAARYLGLAVPSVSMSLRRGEGGADHGITRVVESILAESE
ncbi:MAG: transposase, partial [bacterium]